MKTRLEVVIDAGRETVWRLFDDPDNLSKWQPTLKAFTPTSGIPGQPGATADLVYEESRREITLVETITERREPDFLAGSYESAMGVAIIVNHFEVVDENRTRWVMYSRHSFRGIYRLLGVFFGGAICKRNADLMEHFKLFVESTLAESAT